MKASSPLPSAQGVDEEEDIDLESSVQPLPSNTPQFNYRLNPPSRVASLIASEPSCRTSLIDTPVSWHNSASKEDTTPGSATNSHRRGGKGVAISPALALSIPTRGEGAGPASRHQEDSSAGSTRSCSPNRLDFSDEVGSLYTVCDRGYTAAEEAFKQNAKGMDLDPTEAVLAGIGAHSSHPPLYETLQAALHQYPHTTSAAKKWLPLDKMLGLVNEGNVKGELQSLQPSIPPSQIEQYVDDICKSRCVHCLDGKWVTASRQGIFATLVLSGCTNKLHLFLEAGITDHDLPLHFGSDKILRTRMKLELPMLQKWDARQWDLFEMYQNYVLSPFFKLQPTEGPGPVQVPFHDLEDDIVLPFIEDHEHTRPQEGYHGTIWKVLIHSAHHDCKRDGNQNPYFAVKRLVQKDPDGSKFKEEVKGWTKSIGVTRNRHLIDLLATWHQGGYWYLLFPWANSNLREYWESKTTPADDPASLVPWIAKQCFGIAGGLAQIHRKDSILSKSPTSSHASVSTEGSKYGIHNDIKPENTLWFNDGTQFGKLVICDFGFTRFHRRDSISRASLVGFTHTYQPPERQEISRAWDIWGLGCLYLEFITWYLLGYKDGNLVFEQKRLDDHPADPEGRFDRFFTYIKVDWAKGSRSAMLKPSVAAWILNLRKHPRCSNFFQDFLDLIVEGMLILDAKKRYPCQTVHSKLKTMRTKLKAEGQAYYLECPSPQAIQERPVPSPEHLSLGCSPEELVNLDFRGRLPLASGSSAPRRAGYSPTYLPDSRRASVAGSLPRTPTMDSLLAPGASTPRAPGAKDSVSSLPYRGDARSPFRPISNQRISASPEGIEGRRSPSLKAPARERPRSVRVQVPGEEGGFVHGLAAPVGEPSTAVSIPVQVPIEADEVECASGVVGQSQGVEDEGPPVLVTEVKVNGVKFEDERRRVPVVSGTVDWVARTAKGCARWIGSCWTQRRAAK